MRLSLPFSFQLPVYTANFLMLFLLFARGSAQNANVRSDTVNILKYTISLNITDFTTDTIRGNTVVRFTPRLNNINTLSLDLLKMTVDSVEAANTNLTYTYNDTLLIANLPVTHNIGDTTDLIVYYHGKPVIDPSGWGGFYFTGTYAYNLGVGFQDIPHNYGRVWFPCFDNFVERSKYEFRITTNNTKIAYCNGYLAGDTTINGDRTRTWRMDTEIPSYLASVSIAPYTQVNMTFTGQLGQIPVILTAVPADTVNVKNSFANLDSALNIYEDHYGPYRWNRIGYCMVPFNQGAMEHATNITYPRIFADGTLNYESLMAHEFSHHWWGDMVTCRTAQDMWINEGMAVYSEFLFTEHMYGYQNYITDVRNTHETVIHYAHYKEGGYLPISAVPLAYTYGDHTYKKGAVVAHNMRTYLGDSLFYLGLQYVQNNNQFTDIDAIDFRDDMTTATNINMNDFFNNWVLNGGFPHFSLDSVVSIPNGNNFDVTVYVKQKITGAPALFTNVPLEISFRNASWTETIKNITMSGSTANFTFTLPFNPVHTGINMNTKISDAKTQDIKVIKNIGNHFVFNSRGRMQINVSNSSITSDSAFVYVEHNYAAPDPYKNWGIPYRLSPNRYWKLSGVFPPTFDATATITYDGRNSFSGGAGYLDNALIPVAGLEDSVVLLYRQNAAGEWALFPWYTKTMGNLSDKFGTIKLDSLLPGEYTIAMKDYTMAVQNLQNTTDDLRLTLYPNPTGGDFVVETPGNGTKEITVADITGRIIYHTWSSDNRIYIDLSAMSEGVYFVSVAGKGVKKSGKIIKH